MRTGRENGWGRYRALLLACLLAWSAPGLADDEEPREIDYGDLSGLWLVAKQCVPKYPRKARAAGLPGDVTVTMTIGRDGRVIDVIILDATPPDVFDQATLKCLKTWRFEPAPGATPAAVRTTFNVPFRPGR